MKVLGIDTSTRTCSVAITSEEMPLGEFTMHDRRTHSEKLMPLIDQLLKNLTLDGPALSGIAVARGPGAFTGLRIALGTAQGLARGYGIPLVGVSTLDVLAHQRAAHGLVCPIMDARRGETYTALYRVVTPQMPTRPPSSKVNEKGAQSAQPELKKLWAESIFTPVELAEHLDLALSEMPPETPLTLVGDAASKYGEAIFNHLGQMGNAPKMYYALPAHNLNRGVVVAHLGLQRLQAGEPSPPPYQVAPTYLRKPEAERKRDQKS